MAVQVGVPQVAGFPNLSSGGQGRATPIVYSKKLLQLFYAACAVPDITNTDYEGDVKQPMDTVIVRYAPFVGIDNYNKDMMLMPDRPDIFSDSMVINRAKAYAIGLEYLTKRQTDIPYIEACLGAVAAQMKIVIDLDVLNNIYTSVHANNTGSVAGAVSGMYDLGTPTAPISFNPATCNNVMTMLSAVLEEQNIPEGDWWVLLPPWAIKVLRDSDLRNALFTGDSANLTLRKGRIGQLTDFSIYKNQHLPKNNNIVGCLFGSKLATSFATQFLYEDQVKNPYKLEDIFRGINVYGFKVFQPKALGVVYIQP